MLNQLKLVNSSISFFLERDNLFFLCGFEGNISSSIIEGYYNKFIVVVANPKNKRLLNVHTNEYVNINDSIVMYTGGYSVVIDSGSQVLVINQEFFRNINITKFPVGLIEHVHGALIKRLFELIKHSDNPIYEILALANIVGVDNYRVDVNNQLVKIRQVIEDNYRNEDFNLDNLCRLVYMSKRKVQYILSDGGVSFLELLNGYRVEVLRGLLLKEPRTAVEILSINAGFNNQNTANRVFKSKFGVSISEFKRNIKSSLLIR
jgi:AraC-like DNA-binding protein